jgi:hypothetical protein
LKAESRRLVMIRAAQIADLARGALFEFLHGCLRVRADGPLKHKIILT